MFVGRCLLRNTGYTKLSFEDVVFSSVYSKFLACRPNCHSFVVVVGIALQTKFHGCWYVCDASM
jgi:hypothetical protein